MTKLDFPDTPTTGQQYGSSGTVWRWDGTRWGSTAGAAGARGTVAYAQIAANQGGFTAGGAYNVAGLIVNFNLVAGRTYKFTGSIFSYSNVANDFSQLMLYSGGAVQNGSNTALPTINIPYKTTVEHIWTANASGATSFYLVYGAGVAGSTHTVWARPDYPAFILVEDITYEAGSGGPVAGTLIPACHMGFSSSNSINVPATATLFPCNSAHHDPLFMAVGTGGFAGGIGIPRTGWYQTTAHALLNYNGATPPSMVQVEARINGAADNADNLRQQFWAQANIYDFKVSGSVFYTAGNTINLYMLQIGGANVIPYASQTSAQATSLKVVFLGS